MFNREHTMSDEKQLPILPLRDVVVYPHMVIPLFVGREKSINALNAAMENDDKQILLVAQKEASEDEPKNDDLFSVGTVATILQLLKLPDGTVKVLVEGTRRAEVHEVLQCDPHFIATSQEVMIENLEMEAKSDNSISGYTSNEASYSISLPF
jgi:ATP-dependent Lon protease